MRVRWARVVGLALWALLLVWACTPLFPVWPVSVAPLLLAFTAGGLLTMDGSR